MLPPDLVERVADLEARLEEVFRLLRDRRHEPPAQHDVPFTLAGGLTATTSPRWHARVPSPLTGVVVSLGTAGSSATTVEIYRNGVALASIVMSAGQTHRSVTLGAIVLVPADTLSVGVTVPGTGAADLDVQVRFG